MTFGPIAAFESTYLPGHDRDIAELTGHDRRWQDDVAAVVAAGVKTVRYPIRWHRVEPRQGVYDWSAADRVLDHLRERGLHVMLDLVHHTSYPAWLDDGFRDRRFPAAFVAYAEAVALRYPWLPSYTLLNEPFATLFLAGHEGLWPPYDRGVEGLVRLLQSVLPALSEASRCWSELLPDAAHVWVDTCEQHTGTSEEAAAYAALARDRRHSVLDLALHHDLDPKRPFLAQLLRAGGAPLLNLPPVRVDALGLDYYCHSEWFYDQDGSHSPSPHPVGFAALAQHYGDRYGLPMLLSETNLRGLPSDRVSWLRYVLEQYELALARGVDLRGWCWFPFVDSCDWDSLLARPAGRADPVGVLSLGTDGSRTRTIFTEAWETAVGGAGSSALAAFRLQPPCDRQLAGLLPELSHWPWQDPPDTELVPPLLLAPRGPSVPSTDPAPEPASLERPDRPSLTILAGATPDLVVLSHLRWPWVWQRPQHLVSRLAARRGGVGGRTWFVEEPATADVTEPRLRTEQLEGLTRVWLEVPAGRRVAEVHGFDADGGQDYPAHLSDLLVRQGQRVAPDVWLYTPAALDIAEHLRAGLLVMDVMDDLSSFRQAPEALVLRQRRALAQADVVFAGGRTLHRSVAQHGRPDAHLFPSGVEASHYEGARALRSARVQRVAGYVGVVDERLDLRLLGELAALLPDWTVRVVGPVTKIDPGALPQAPNLQYLGLTPYERLPEVMGGLDVALMPFALNEATRSISPTKTLEYLAAGLPVVSTRVPDVVADYVRVVHFAHDGASFARACREVVEQSGEQRDRRRLALQARHEWDDIADRMIALVEAARRRAPALTALAGDPA